MLASLAPMWRSMSGRGFVDFFLIEIYRYTDRTRLYKYRCKYFISVNFAHQRQGDVIIIGSSFTWKKLTLVIIHFDIVSVFEQLAGTFVEGSFTRREGKLI